MATNPETSRPAPRPGQTWRAGTRAQHTEDREILTVTQFAIRYANSVGVWLIAWPGWNGWVRQHDAGPIPRETNNVAA